MTNSLPIESSFKSVEFLVEYPWGSNYLAEIATAAIKLGYSATSSPLEEGTDSVGLFIAKSQPQLDKAVNAAIKLAEDRKSEVSDMSIEEDFYDILTKERVVYLFQDWKDLDWEHDVKPLKEIGLYLKEVEGDEMVFKLSKESTAALEAAIHMKPSTKMKLIEHYAETYVDGLDSLDRGEGMQHMIINGVVGLSTMDDKDLKNEISYLYNDPTDYPTGLSKEETGELMTFFGHKPLEEEEEA